MNEMLFLVIAFLTGLVLGAFFFGGLWLTVKKSVVSNKPALWFFTSYILRVGITLLGFYFISQGSWQRILICFLGFFIARFIVIRTTKAIDEKQIKLNKTVNHEA